MPGRDIPRCLKKLGSLQEAITQDHLPAVKALLEHNVPYSDPSTHGTRSDNCDVLESATIGVIGC